MSGLALALQLVASGASHAQSAESAATLGQQFQQYSQQTLTEQLFLHLDRPAYSAGETLWLKAYAVDGTHHRPLPMSKVAYVEVLDANQRPVLQAKIALVRAVGQGALELPAELATGRYVVRAYTNWMKNAGPDFYFQCPITIVNTQQARPTATLTAGPAYDVQFFPEGGQLVQGLPGRVAFKVTDRRGHSVAATGTVADASGASVATFQTLRNGLGSFLLTPTGSAYTATVRLPGGAIVTSKLPAAAEQGYALRVTDENPTELTVSVQTKLTQSGAPLRLLAHTGQHVTALAEAALHSGRVVFRIAKKQLQPGITHLTIFSGQRPVAERLYFRRPTQSQSLVVQASASAAAFGPRSQVRLQLGAAQPAELSLAVYRLDSLSASAPADIRSYLLLAADLKGFIEDADYYFRDSSAVAQQAADNLMLTQGWRRFRWEDALTGQPPAATYPPELNGYLVQGRVRQATGAPAAEVPAYLALPGNSFWFGNSTSHSDGLVQFEIPQTYGLRKLILQTNPALDSTLRVELLSPFTVGGGTAGPGLPALTGRWAATFTERHLQAQVRQAFPTPPRYQAVPLDTIPFYGRATEHYRLDAYTRFPTLEDVMREYVPGVLVRKRKDGFHFLVTDKLRHGILKENPLTLLDGLPLFDLNQLLAFDPLKIKTLDVVDSRYFSGQQVHEGVVSYRTYKGDLAGYALNPHALLEEYELMQVPREFYAPRYDTEAQQHSRLPDLRNLLYWNPTINLAAGKPQTLDFFTSDQAGRYLVVTQGLTPDGQLGSNSFSFEVKPAL